MQFAPFASDIELPFYTSLASHKINHDKLDDSARKLLGLYEVRPTDPPAASCRMQVHGNALTSDEVPAGYCRAEGMIKNVNTIEEYRTMDKAAVLQRAGLTIWDAITDGTIYSCPSLLASFSVISFADLKRYRFTYWFVFPALHSDPAWKLDEPRPDGEPGRLDGQETTNLVERVQTWRYSVDARQHGFFLAKKVRLSARERAAADERADEVSNAASTPRSPGRALDFRWEVGPLSGYEDGFFDGAGPEDRFVAFADPSTYPKNPGWMLRNLLVLVRQRWRLDRVQILCYRDVQSRRDDGRSIILNLSLDGPGPVDGRPRQMPKVTGWERNKEQKLASKTANLAEYLDPQRYEHTTPDSSDPKRPAKKRIRSRLADQSVDLNLKLMRWRIAPNLDLERIKNAKCLLLGAGTLGSYVARNLLGWGVRKISFVDNATVSFSNPVRQPLFDFKDCLGGGAKKAYRAAEALAEIYPGVEANGHVMSVAMAGHPITDEERSRGEFERLQRLVDEHDVIFLLMDTRESRWLPTVMGKAAGKLVMNAALGFDTYVVMRHGVRPEGATPAPAAGEELGCYFCNDVVAPADSVKDQTLDQQCTVTRPGIAAMASALLVETMVSVLQHPLGAAAPAPASQDADRAGHALGIVPHQIRGFLATFQNMVIRGRSYDCCSACSPPIVDAYRADGWAFVRRALNEKGYVEELSGLAEVGLHTMGKAVLTSSQVQRTAESAAADIDWDEGDAGEDEGEGEMI
ncbi:MAG: Autophagy protein 7 [Thelocarpon impressellum]|nr:MAG: Autophagy protein 7 [Thelocarpon impressellum]